MLKKTFLSINDAKRRIYIRPKILGLDKIQQDGNEGFRAVSALLNCNDRLGINNDKEQLHSIGNGESYV